MGLEVQLWSPDRSWILELQDLHAIAGAVTEVTLLELYRPQKLVKLDKTSWSYWPSLTDQNFFILYFEHELDNCVYKQIFVCADYIKLIEQLSMFTCLYYKQTFEKVLPAIDSFSGLHWQIPAHG